MSSGDCLLTVATFEAVPCLISLDLNISRHCSGSRVICGMREPVGSRLFCQGSSRSSKSRNQWPVWTWKLRSLLAKDTVSDGILFHLGWRMVEQSIFTSDFVSQKQGPSSLPLSSSVSRCNRNPFLSRALMGDQGFIFRYHNLAQLKWDFHSMDLRRLTILTTLHLALHSQLCTQP